MSFLVSLVADVLVAILLVAAATLPQAAQLWAPWMGDLSITDPVRVISAMLMIYQPTYMDILPQYIVYMLVSPFALWLCLHKRWGVVALVSFIAWLVAQLGLHTVLTGPLDRALAGSDPLPAPGPSTGSGRPHLRVVPDVSAAREDGSDRHSGGAGGSGPAAR